MIGKEVNVIPSQGTVMTHKGLFNFEKLMEEGKNYSLKRSYDYTETNHTEKYKDRGNEFNIEWGFEKKVEDNMKYHINTEMLITYAKKTKGYIQGNIKIVIKAYIDLDYQERWQNTALNKFLFYFYNNIVKRQKIYYYHYPKLKREYEEFRGILKDILQLHQ